MSMSPNEIAQRNYRDRRTVIAEVREMPVWDADDESDLSTKREAYNALRRHALHLARLLEKEMQARPLQRVWRTSKDKFQEPRAAGERRWRGRNQEKENDEA